MIVRLQWRFKLQPYFFAYFGDILKKSLRGVAMLKKRIEELREKLNKSLETMSPDDGYVLKLSQELDKLIVLYYKQENKEDRSSKSS